MTTKAEFNAEEWSRVLLGPFVAGMTLLAAERGGTLRESVEIAKVYAEEKQDPAAPELIRELVSDRPSVDPERFAPQGGEKATPEDVRARGHEILRDALGVLEGKAEADEIDAYKRFCLEIAQRVAERTKSGGVLGVGAKSVAEAEQAALDALAAALGVSAPPGTSTA